MRRISPAWLAAAAVLLATAGPVAGFKPNDEGHLGITTEALVPIVRTIGGRALRFSTSAVKGVRDANRTVDVSASFFGVAEHFDDDSFGGATTRLQNLKASVIAKITALHPDGAGAREDL